MTQQGHQRPCASPLTSFFQWGSPVRLALMWLTKTDDSTVTFLDLDTSHRPLIGCSPGSKSECRMGGKSLQFCSVGFWANDQPDTIFRATVASDFGRQKANSDVICKNRYVKKNSQKPYYISCWFQHEFLPPVHYFRHFTIILADSVAKWPK